ncbi:hypothetical protein GCM10023347_14510 [Streptomyces chumphonensis]|uniref:Uncharacterized protein n=1 Tax=Streptomyces chumphonensis TaxID=1214925 RepID=A0A927IBZ1_9ACTN|nr:hypothetical protein [Streptomyces chumphonensis]MBD3931365.1 hypothetical protein [Streptomyces chumphonensis]
MTRSRLAPGVEVVAVPGGGPALRTADGEFLRISTGQADPDHLLARLTGRAASASDADALDRLVAAFADAGYLTEAGDEHGHEPPPWPRHHRDVQLLGAPALTGPLAACLAAAGAAPRTVPPAEVGAGRPAAVVWCLDGPVPPGLWDEADQLPDRGTAWLRCHREGHQLWIEPPACGPGDVSAAHVRSRRLAATPAHRELAAYWAGHRTAGAPVTLGPAAAAFVAALLAADLTHWATDAAPRPGALPVTRRLRRVDLRDLTVTQHAVLPVPPVAPPVRPRR